MVRKQEAKCASPPKKSGFYEKVSEWFSITLFLSNSNRKLIQFPVFLFALLIRPKRQTLRRFSEYADFNNCCAVE